MADFAVRLQGAGHNPSPLAGEGRGGLRHFELAEGVIRALTRGVLGREFVPQPRYFLLLRQKKVSKEKATRDTRPAGSLRFSKVAAAAELAPARWAGTQTVLADPPAPSCDARRSSREPVRGDAIYRATINGFSGGQLAVYLTQAELMLQRLHYPGQLPVESAEHRRLKRGSRRGLFEQQTAGLMRVPQPPQLLRSAGHPQPQAEGVTSGSPSLGYLSWRDKKGTVPAGHPRHLITRVSAQRRATHKQSFCASPQPALLLPCKQARKPISMRPAGPRFNGGQHA